MISGKIPIAVLLLVLNAQSIRASDTDVTHRLGVSGGFPQLIALTYQATISRHFSLETCLGCIPYYYNTAGFRIIAGDSSNGFKPRYFIGLSVVDHSYSANPDAVTSYLWTGAGMGYAFNSFRLFVDLGYIGGGDRDKGLGYSTGLALNGGLLFDL